MFGNAGRFLGLWNSCCQAIYSYIGVELIGIAADECERQRQVIPRAVRRVSYRVIFYYVGAVCVLGLNLASDDPILNLNLQTGREYSPFVLMFERAGIPALRHIINSCALIASISAANTELYVGVRFLGDLRLMLEPNIARISLRKTSTRNL
jgi:amino acid transporter